MVAKDLTGRRLEQYADNYVVFDLETTGVSSKEDFIIEISAVKVKNHVVMDQFTTLVNPGMHIPAGATKVNGITDDMAIKAPNLRNVLPEFLSFIEGEILVGHNIQSFDLKFLSRAAEELLGLEVPNDYVDTLYMARTVLPMLRRHRLTDLSQYFNVPTDGAHRALNDCIMNQKCYEYMGQLNVEKKEEEFCPVCGSVLRRRNGKFGDFYGCSNFPKCRFTRNT
ncbi:exonuclease domain-containing protein [Clostridium sp. E02]|uniref:3'-5' exonuclease n=1 Tax=Clostridium sp. E02 TaxID=2487134 RepID=UPI000F545D85|nr:exonuclease domain-containing protein [Clostridium sp. E02]